MALTKKANSDAYATLIDLIYDKPNAFVGALTEAIADGELDAHIRKIAKSCFMRRHTLEESAEQDALVNDIVKTDQDGMAPVEPKRHIIPKLPHGARAGGKEVMKIGSNRYFVTDIVGTEFSFPSGIKPQALAGVFARVTSVDPSRNALGCLLLTAPNRRGNYYDAWAGGQVIWTRMVPSNPLRKLLFEQ